MSLRLFPITEQTDRRNVRTIAAYEDEMRQRDEIDKKTPLVQFYNGYAYVDKRPIDAEVADGKKQRVFYNQTQIFGKVAAQQSANAVLSAQRPYETRDFPDV